MIKKNIFKTCLIFHLNNKLKNLQQIFKNKNKEVKSQIYPKVKIIIIILIVKQKINLKLKEALVYQKLIMIKK